MRKIILYLLLLIISGYLIYVLKNDSSLKSLSINIIAAAIIILLEKIIENYNYLWIWLITNTWFRNVKIRLSISYLFKIKVNDKYLLIKGRRIKNQYQPVGGVFKRYRESFYALERLDVTDDDNVPIDDQSIDDLRIKLPGKNVMEFLKWYNSQLGREVSPQREFYEELVSPEILTKKNFPYINYLHLRRHMTNIRYSNHFQCYEILIAEIFELKPNEEQQKELLGKISTNDDNLIWAKEDLIVRRGAIPGTRSEFTISETSSWIL